MELRFFHFAAHGLLIAALLLPLPLPPRAPPASSAPLWGQTPAAPGWGSGARCQAGSREQPDRPTAQRGQTHSTTQTDPRHCRQPPRRANSCQGPWVRDGAQEPRPSSRFGRLRSRSGAGDGGETETSAREPSPAPPSASTARRLVPGLGAEASGQGSGEDNAALWAEHSSPVPTENRRWQSPWQRHSRGGPILHPLRSPPPGAMYSCISAWMRLGGDSADVTRHPGASLLERERGGWQRGRTPAAPHQQVPWGTPRQPQGWSQSWARRWAFPSQNRSVRPRRFLEMAALPLPPPAHAAPQPGQAAGC